VIPNIPLAHANKLGPFSERGPCKEFTSKDNDHPKLCF
jgi:hypothetical protein